MTKHSHDILIIGAGPGGYVAAIRARQLGLRVGLIERTHLGGICLNWGCIPTKAMLKATDVLHQAEQASRFGLYPLTPAIAPDRLVARAAEVSGQLATGVAFLLKKNGVDLIWGAARLTSAGGVEVAASETPAPRGALGPGHYAAPHVILATGARPRSLPGLEPDGRLIWTYYQALRPPEVPASLLVLGSGAIGVEFASIYAAMGPRVTLVEREPRILPLEDALALPEQPNLPGTIDQHPNWRRRLAGDAARLLDAPKVARRLEVFARARPRAQET